MVKMSRKFKDAPMTPAETVTYWVEYIVRHGKDTLRSPVVDMPWWQVHLIDVYGFILLVIFVIFYVLKKIVKLFISFMFLSKNKLDINLKKKNS